MLVGTPSGLEWGRVVSKLDELVEKYAEELTDLGVPVNKPILRAVAKGLGRTLYRADAALVAAADRREVERVRRNYLIKKLGLRDTKRLDAGLEDVIELYTKRRKYRVVFYYLLARRFRRFSVYR